MVIANAYAKKFLKVLYRSSGNEYKVESEFLYDFLYERDYEAWFCNMAKQIFTERGLKEWLMRIHTGESFYSVTQNWSWDNRISLGQSYLKNLARDFIVWYESESDQWRQNFKSLYEEMIRRLEMDGYIFKDKELYQSEAGVLDIETEAGLLGKLHDSLGLADKKLPFEFLKLAEDHYIASRWSDCISNARKFFEAILQQIVSKHSTSLKGIEISSKTIESPVAIRDYLEKEGLLEKKEREAVDKFYALLSHTGGHPYMAEKDQARLLRQICITLTQFIMLRLEGALNKTKGNINILPLKNPD